MFRRHRREFAGLLILVLSGLFVSGTARSAEGTVERAPLRLTQTQPADLASVLREKQRRARDGMREMQRRGHDSAPVRESLVRFNQLMSERKFRDAEAVLDEALRLVDDMQGGGESAGRVGSAPAASSFAAGAQTPLRPSGEAIEGLIAYGDIDDRRRKQIFIVAGNGENRRQLTDGEDDKGMPDISPDGALVAYVSQVRGKGTVIRVISMDGTYRKRLTRAGAGKTSFAPAWSPDGTKIAYTHGTCRTKQPPCPVNIWVMDADGSNKKRLTGGNAADVYPTWSPDGKKIAFFSHRDGGLAQIWVMDAETGGQLERLTTAYYDETLKANIEQKVPAWSPDGNYIAYWQGVEMDDRRPTGEVPRDVWIMNADGSNQRLLVSGDDPKWSPDSQTVIFPINRPSERNGLPLGIGAIDADGSNRRVLLYTNGYFGSASWRGPVPAN